MTSSFIEILSLTIIALFFSFDGLLYLPLLHEKIAISPSDYTVTTHIHTSDISAIVIENQAGETQILPPPPPPQILPRQMLSRKANIKLYKPNKRRPKKNNSHAKIEHGLAQARASIKEAIRLKNYTSDKIENYVPRGSIYRNPYAFQQSHIEMMKRFKVWVYKEGELPLFHIGPMSNIYSIEGQFIDLIESKTSQFLALNPNNAHAFFIPVSVSKMVDFLYKPLVTYARDQLQRVVTDYIDVIADQYPYWNKSNGADHFFLSCHDWAPDISKADPNKYKYFIRALCNANTTEGFEPQRDVSIPEINISKGNLDPPVEGLDPDNRTILAFFAGGKHGHIREVLLYEWQDKDDEIQVHEYLKEKRDYFKSMAQSRYCLCPSGYEVASPRIVTSFQLGCVPVIISESYALPFADVLDWEKFSIHIPSNNISDIKKILKEIPHDKYLKMQKRVKQVSRHFVVNRPAQPFDAFHMILHSIFLRRLNFRLPH